MQINNAIVHKIEKVVQSPSVLELRPTTLVINNELNDLLDHLIDLYNNKTGRGYGKFDTDVVSYPFSGLLDDFNNQTTDFISFTHLAMNNLQSRIDGQGFATGGYILFIEYDHNARKIMLVVSLKDREGFVFDANLNLDNQHHIDLEHLHEMARVDVTKWKTPNSERYLSFAKKRQNSDKSFSKYFRDFIGCDEFEEEMQLTKNVVNAIKQYANFGPVSDERKAHITQITHDYMHELNKTNGTFKIQDLATRLDQDIPQRFSTFVSSCDIEISDGFKPNRSAFIGLKRKTVKQGTVSVSFNVSDFGNTVNYQEGDDFIRVSLSQDKINELIN